MLSEKGVSAAPEKIKSVRNYPTPKNVKDVVHTLHLQEALQDSTDAAKALTELTKKDQKFAWCQSTRSL
jgi:hypothetical protein